MAAVKIALIGNPNCGKTTLFNRLTGRRAKVGNMPGVTVHANAAPARTAPKATLIDLPGTYSLYATAQDEQVAQEVLLGGHPRHNPDMIWIVVEEGQIRSSLHLVLQCLALGYPAGVVLNSTGSEVSVETRYLEEKLGVPVRKLDIVKAERNDVEALLDWNLTAAVSPEEAQASRTSYLLNRVAVPHWFTQEESARLSKIHAERSKSASQLQLEEISGRMPRVRAITEGLGRTPDEKKRMDFERKARRTTRWDAVLTHPLWGHLILVAVFFGLFQAIYTWSVWPMDFIDMQFTALMGGVESALPASWWRDLLVDGVLAGIGGIVVFVPQIMILFGLIAALEQTGYMARVSFLGDRFFQSIGMSGRSIVPLVGGLACAVPAVMAARAIPGKRARLLTILVTPMMTCSARLPVYAFLIAFIVPDSNASGISTQGLVLFALYAAGALAAVVLSAVLHWALPKRNDVSQYTIQWPAYRLPRPRLILQEMADKGWTFVSSAGRVILVISIVLWGLSRFGPGDAMHEVETQFSQATTPEELALKEQALLESSYIGMLGQSIEPIVAPLGFTGKMGIAILTSFAAREVFVGTMSTLYPSIDGNLAEGGTQEGRIAQLQRQLHGEITVGSACALIVFYLFAMQCMSTVVIVRRELDSWPWALGQAIGFTLLAYAAAWAVFLIV
jgi:ferrous iron transport protein B